MLGGGEYLRELLIRFIFLQVKLGDNCKIWQETSFISLYPIYSEIS